MQRQVEQADNDGQSLQLFEESGKIPGLQFPEVIYRRRDQILAGSDLREETMEYFAQAVDGVIRSHAGEESGDEWDTDGLLTELQNYWPTTLSSDDLESARNADDLYERVMSEATSYYEQREQTVGPELSRDIERQVMLRLIDQHWRDHLYEMDYLSEGIHLRAYGQKDPAVEWQREGFDMFAQMMSGIADDFVKYIMHVQVAIEPAPQAQITNVQYSAPEDPVQGAPAIVSAPVADGAPPRTEDVVQQPVVKSEWDKTPRNAPCPCGSGKKFKLCHGK
jgi:preprotein translocase subunit SecA